jgi:hypothetical protein
MVAPKGPFQVGKVAKFEAKKPNPATAYPHFTEDRVVVGEVLDRPAPQGSTAILQRAAFDTLEQLFDGHLVVDGMKGYVPVDSRCRSLGGLKVNPKEVTMEAYRNPKGKNRLRLRFRVGGLLLAPNVTSSRAYEQYEAGNLDSVNSKISKASALILRIGLARAFPDVPNRCYLQINGLGMF